MPFRLRSILDPATRRERGRGISSWWRSLRRPPPVAATDAPKPASPLPSRSDSQPDTQTTTLLPSSSSPSPHSHTDSSQELTFNQTMPQSACDTDRGDRGGLRHGGQGLDVHSEDNTPLEDLPPLSFPTPEPLMPESFPHNFASPSAQATDATDTSFQAVPIPISASTTPGTDARSNLVLPIIVIGLQALGTGRDSTNLSHLHDHLHQHDRAHNRTDNEHDVLELDGHPHLPGQFQPSQEFLLEDQVQTQLEHPSRPRTWQDRTFNAFRNLRRNRRNESSAADPSSADSVLPRTLLIYVIGGLSPADQPVILGGNLDSFEALWELAEFLGQVKPQTASKEDIERSGLEVIQASSLEEYEKTERVASNCTEQCLICLDDYAPEDNLRVLTCKHAFHQSCVDKWLETGRNNCPACRSKGVENTSSSSSTTADVSAPTDE